MSDRMIGIPDIAGWPLREIGEVCELISRGFAPAYVEYSPVKVIGQRCVQNSGFDDAAVRFNDSRVTRALYAKAGDVLLNSTGTGTIGRSCVFQEEDGRYIVDSHVTVLRPSASLDSRWVNSLLRSSWGQRYLESYCYTGSTNQVELSRSELIGTKIPVPSLAEQRQITEILDSLDDQINAMNQQIVKLNLLRQGMLDDLLTGRVRTRTE